ncbi:MAG: N-acetylmuramoyl-L-alanine amidase [Candidatus Omnitrophica bacterium]|nr:N-acetylmuramoyl-L-alanine amidase [Candidatus Omnitrophota bacterium]
MAKNVFIRNLKLWGVASVFVLLASGCAHEGPTMSPRMISPMRPVTAPIPMQLYTPFTHAQTIQHVVGPSETLWRISKMYDVDIQTLIQVNHLRNASELKKGQLIIIPQTYGPRPVIALYPNHKWRYIIVHHTATDVGNALDIDRSHMARGWDSLGYHFLIDNGTDGKFPGQIEIGPRWVKQQDGAHTKASDMNAKGIGIALVGNYSETGVPSEQFNALVFLVRTLQDYYHIPNANVIGHRDVPGANTECPGNKFPWREFKQSLSS